MTDILDPSWRGSVAILIPCHNEEATIGKVVADFRRELPSADIYVYDNCSTDATARVAHGAGALVRKEKRKGKGFVVASMFEQIEADIYVLVDGDDTYHSPSVGGMIALLVAGDADMVVASRTQGVNESSFRRFHHLGNRLVCRIVNLVFGSDIHDIFSGYRAMTRDVVKSIPVIARGFDVETELTLQTLYRRFVIREIHAPYGQRPRGSESKLRTIPDGAKVLLRIFLILQSYKPLTFFGSAGILAFLCALASGYAPVMEYLDTRYVLSVPRAVLAASLAIVSLLSITVGINLHSTNFRLMELEKIVRKGSASSGEKSGVHRTDPSTHS